jgi:hypothetical protein
MNTYRVKTLVAALALAGFATACDRDTAQRDAYVTPESSTIDRATTAQGTTEPDALSTVEGNGYSTDSHSGELNMSGDLAKPDHEEEVQFSGLELTPESEGKLEELVQSLDKEKPVKIIVAMDEQVFENPAGEQTATSSQQPGITEGVREDYTSALGQRVETVKQFMEEKGIEVTQWQFERMEEQDLAQQRNSQESAEDVQSVRLVILASDQEGSLSSVMEE